MLDPPLPSPAPSPEASGKTPSMSPEPTSPRPSPDDASPGHGSAHSRESRKTSKACLNQILLLILLENRLGQSKKNSQEMMAMNALEKVLQNGMQKGKMFPHALESLL